MKTIVTSCPESCDKGCAYNPCRRGSPTVTISIPDRGNGTVKPVRVYVENDVLIQEFEIVDGPRKGQILMLRTRFQK